ncbi:LPXTG-motif cell wall-anchored protein [Streptococcus gallinaceus]|nr:LPXTG cell wall anchor domain-containing protein [Streptococcus gallinaceus]MCP1639952.1 LPXTG-motif cell wall-anchored protein [Streptococcus gallinaceus]MCP1770676.1 LPXTG-motif cell wall-anchored protein [Streptococcus gallinaceus]
MPSPAVKTKGLPKTGDQQGRLAIVLGSILLGFSVLVGVKKRQK